MTFNFQQKMNQLLNHLHSTVEEDIDNHCMVNSYDNLNNSIGNDNNSNNSDNNNNNYGNHGNINFHDTTDMNGFILKCFIDSILNDVSVSKDFRNLPLKIISIHVKIDIKLLVDIILIVNKDFKCSSDFAKCCVEILDMIEFYFDNIIIKNTQSLPMIYNIHEVIAMMRIDIEKIKNATEKTGILFYSSQNKFYDGNYRLIIIIITSIFYSCKIYRHHSR